MSTRASDGDWIIPESVADTFERIANALYVLFALLFGAGLYFDWQAPGQVIIPPLAVVQDPYPNSGVILAAIIVAIIGYAFGKASSFIEEMNQEEFDQTQEWTVDIKGRSTDTQNDG